MAEDVPLQVVQETQTSLGKYIKDPPLTEKLLIKPPFRFLQDIIKSVIRETGFLGDVYTVEELSEPITAKEKKVAFLKNVISATQDATGTTISARPSKIVSGLEVTKTLQLLQAVAAGVALKQSGAIVKPPVIEEKKEKKKSKDLTKKSESKKGSDEKKEDSGKQKKVKKSGNEVKKDEGVIEVNGEKKNKSAEEGGEEKKKKKRDKSAEERKKRDRSAKDVGGGGEKSDKSIKDGDGKKRDESAKEGSREKKKRDKSGREVNGEDRKRDRSAKEKIGTDVNGEDRKRDRSAKEKIGTDVNGEDRKRDKSGREKTERPPSRRPSLDGTQAAVPQEENPVPTGGNGEAPSHTNGSLGNGGPLVNGNGPPDVLEEAKENIEPQLPSGLRKSSLDVGKEKFDKENREKPDKLEKKERSKEGSAAERKHSSRRSSSKVRPSSKDADKIEKPVREKKEDEPTVLGTGDTPLVAPKPERPQTARKAPPSARPQSMRPPSARPGAPKIRDRGEVKTDLNEIETEVKAVAVITDLEKLQDDENTVTLERQALSPDFDTQGSHFLDLANKVGENEGALVAQILETKKELEETGQIIGGDSTQRNIEIEWEGGRKQKKEAWGKEITKLREGIQQLTRLTNPLGKLFDFLQEDVDSMQRELKTWKETNTSYTKQLENERRLMENSLETYRRQLAELDSLIDQETETLKNMKANVLANDRKIYSLLTKTSTE